jgi:hypothetical protein
MGTFAETATVVHCSSFTDQGKQLSFSDSVCSKQTEVRLPTKENKLSFSDSVCSKQTEVLPLPFFVCNIRTKVAFKIGEF